MSIVVKKIKFMLIVLRCNANVYCLKMLNCVNCLTVKFMYTVLKCKAYVKFLRMLTLCLSPQMESLCQLS